MIAAWLLFPALAIVCALGTGLLLERLAGAQLPGATLPAVGFAGMVCLTQLCTWSGATAELALPAVLVAALAGGALSHARLRALRPDRGLAAGGLVVLVATAAPIVLTGDATFTGYGVLGDTSIHLLGADWLAHHGRDFGALAPSSTQAAIGAYFAIGYPSGAHTVLGALDVPVSDPAWAFAPYLALLATAGALAPAPLATGLVRGAPARAALVVVAGLPALAYGFVLQGSIKEVATIALLAPLGALLPWFHAHGAGVRLTIPLAVVAAALVAVVSLPALVWLGPFALAGLALSARRGGAWRPRQAALAAAAFAALAALLALPTLTALNDFVDVATAVLTNPHELGNLRTPLPSWQAFPAWPSEDVRLPPDAAGRWVFVGVSVACALAGLAAAVRERARAWGLLVFAAVELVGWVYLSRRGSPWADAKALAIAAPAVGLLAALGPLSDRRGEGRVLLALLLAGVGWTVALQYRGSSPAPRARLEQLAALDDQLSGRGPTLVPQFEEYAKHFLRDARPESVSDQWRSRPDAEALRPGVTRTRLGRSFDLDELAPAYVQRYPRILVRRGPSSSRPPATYRSVARTANYELWERGPGRVLAHFPLGDRDRAEAVPDCAAIGSFVHESRARGARLVAAERLAAARFAPVSVTPLPPRWRPGIEDQTAVVTVGGGRVDGQIDVPASGAYDVWINGSFGRATTVDVGGQRAGTVEHELNAASLPQRLGTLTLQAGAQPVSVTVGGAGWAPGDGDAGRLLGPVALVPAGGEDARLRELPPSQWRALCGRALDWIELTDR